MNKEALRQQLRSQAPDLAAFMDDLRGEFPGLKVTYLKVGETELGLKMDESRFVEMEDSTPISQLKKQWAAQLKEDIENHQRLMKGPKRRAAAPIKTRKK
jgi:hypothetical protein